MLTSLELPSTASFDQAEVPTLGPSSAISQLPGFLPTPPDMPRPKKLIEIPDSSKRIPVLGRWLQRRLTRSSLHNHRINFPQSLVDLPIPRLIPNHRLEQVLQMRDLHGWLQVNACE